MGDGITHIGWSWLPQIRDASARTRKGAVLCGARERKARHLATRQLRKRFFHFQRNENGPEHLNRFKYLTEGNKQQ